MPTPRGACFTGRDTELATLGAALDAAAQGRGRLVVLTGDPGIGKTCTASAIATAAAERGMTVAWGRCWEHLGAPAYWPWLQALGAYAASTTGPAAVAATEGLALLRAEATDADRARVELFDGVTKVFATIARQRPLLLALDDLHWADGGSLLLLQFLAREIDGLPLLVVGTLRDAAVAERAVLADVLRLAQSIPLRGLERPAVRALLADGLGHAPSDATVDQVLATTEGNPFFVIETAQLLAAGDDDTVSHGVRDVLRRRLAPLPPASRRVLDVAAVVGREFDPAWLATLLAEPLATIHEALAPAAALKLVHGRDDRWAFGHVLLRETLYDGVPADERIRLHGALGELLERIAVADDVRLPLLAHHFAASAHPAKALHWSCEASERALRLMAYEDAARYADHALAAADGDARLRPLLALAEALHLAGERERADAVFADAIDLARRQGPSTFAETVLRCARVRTELGLLDTETNALLGDALARMPNEPSAPRARLMARLAAGLHLVPSARDRRRRLADEAVAMARTLGDPSTLTFALMRRIHALLGPDDGDERLAAADELLHVAGTDRRTALEALIVRIHELAEAADRTGLDWALLTFAQKARSVGHPFFRWMNASFQTAMALGEGRFADAEGLAAEALALGRQAQSRTALLNYAQQLFALRGEQGRLDEVEPLVTAGAAETAVVPAWRCGLANFYSVAGRDVEARREFEAIADDDFAGLPRDTTWLTATLLLADIAARLGDARRAAILYDLMRPHAGRIAVARPLVVMVGPLDHRLGVLAASLGRHDAADAHFERAFAIATRMRALPWQAHVRHDRAVAWLARGERDRALRLLDEAEAVARPLGMRLLLGWIERTRAGAAPSAANDARRGAFRREGDVWMLTFEGRTTRIRDMVGLGHLLRLLREPDRDVHVRELTAPGAPMDRGDAGAVLDRRARDDYESRLRDARAERDEAERLNDLGRLERLGDEIAFLTTELARGFGLGGRARRAGSPDERARVAVTRAIKYAIERIDAHDTALAEHLRRAVRTGTFCAYAPAMRERVAWTLDDRNVAS